MSERPEPGHDGPRWEKPDFEVTPLSDLEERPGPDHDGDEPAS
jgi:hypothetical protein